MIDYASVASFFVSTAINLIVVGTLIAITASLVLRLTLGAPPRLRYVFTLMAFVCAATLPFVLALARSEQTEFQRASYAGARVENLPIPSGPNGFGNTVESQVRPFETDPRRIGTEAGITAWRFLLGVLYTPSVSIAVLSLWILGACLLFIREVVAHFGVAHARRKFIKADPKLLQRLIWPQNVALYVDEHCGPYALGITNSIVVIPRRLCAELSEEAVSQIARHELDHLKWRDPFVNAAMRLVLALLWPSAPLWYLNRLAKLEREAAADRAAVAAKGGELRKDTAAADYASALVAIGRKYARKNSRPYALVATEMGDQRGLNERVRRLLTTSSPPTVLRLIIASATLLAAASFINVLPVASLRSKGKQLERAVSNVHLALSDPKPLVDASHDSQKEVSTPAIHSPAQRRLPDLTSEPSTQRRLLESESSNKASAANATVEVRPSSSSTDVGNDFEAQMAALGYTNLTSDQISRMRQYAVGPAYVRELAEFGYRGLDAETLITFKWLAVSGAYIKEMKSLGYERLKPTLLAQFRQHGVSSQYIKEIRSRLTGQITAEQLGSLRLFGASTDFLDKLKALGYENLNANQVISMRLQGVTIAYIEQIQARLTTRISADELISMRMRNIY